MRTPTILGAIAFALACDAPTAPRSPAQAFTRTSAAVLVNERTEYVFFAGGECAGSVEMNIVVHDLFALTDDGAGGFHVKTHESVDGRGSNPVTGVGYVLNDVANIEYHAAAGVQYTLTEHVNVIGKGNAINQVVQFDIHTTITPNGDITSSHDHFRFVCQG